MVRTHAAATLAVGSMVACVPGATGTRPVATAEASPRFASAIENARRLLRDSDAPWVGAAVAVFHDGAPVWVEGFGEQSREAGTAVDPERTLFRIYSVAKPMTATAGARLMEAGRVDPSAPVQRYVPGFPAKEWPITAMELATHRSGIRHYASDEEAAGLRHCDSVGEALEIFQDDPLVHRPGTAETYSSWGYVVLSATVAGAAGTSFAEAMNQLVFEPSGMRGIRLEGSPDPRAPFYDERDGRIVPARAVDNTCKWGAGGFIATAPDVAAFGAALLDGTLLTPQSLQLFLRGEDVYRAQGVGAGGTAFLLIDAANDLSIALLSNTSGELSGPALQQALDDLHREFATLLQ